MHQMDSEKSEGFRAVGSARAHSLRTLYTRCRGCCKLRVAGVSAARRARIDHGVWVSAGGSGSDAVAAAGSAGLAAAAAFRVVLAGGVGGVGPVWLRGGPSARRGGPAGL